MTFPAPVKTPAVVARFLTDHADWDADIIVRVGKHKPGWTPGKAVLIIPDGGPTEDLPIIGEMFSLHCYGPTDKEAYEVANLCHRVLRFDRDVEVITSQGVIALLFAERISGPTPIQEPETGWDRYTATYYVEMTDQVVG